MIESSSSPTSVDTSKSKVLEIGRLLTVAQAARRKRVSRHLVYKWIADGRLRPVRRQPNLIEPADLRGLKPGKPGRRPSRNVLSHKDL